VKSSKEDVREALELIGRRAMTGKEYARIGKD
jgi:hypothetical protein